MKRCQSDTRAAPSPARAATVGRCASMQVTVIGAGAMGSLFGALLQRAGSAVTLVDVRAEHVAALRKRDLTIEESDGARLSVRVPTTTDASEALAADLFLLFV